MAAWRMILDLSILRTFLIAPLPIVNFPSASSVTLRTGAVFTQDLCGLKKMRRKPAGPTLNVHDAGQERSGGDRRNLIMERPMKRATKIATIALMAGMAVTATGLTASAFGGKGGPMGGKGGPMGGFMQMEFADVDMDKSGFITAEDLMAQAEAKFAAADANGDGALDLAEIKAQAEAHMKERMASAPEGKAGKRMGKGPSAEKRMGWMAERIIEKRDADKSGTLTLAEMSPDQTKLDRMIDRFDTDDDNAISAAEFDAAQKEMWMRHGQDHGGKRHGKSSKHGG